MHFMFDIVFFTDVKISFAATVMSELGMLGNVTD